MKRMFSKKQIQEISKLVAQELIDNTPKGIDYDNPPSNLIEVVINGHTLEYGILPIGDFEELTTDQISIAESNMKKAMNDGLIKVTSATQNIFLFLTMCEIDNEVLSLVFGGIDTTGEDNSSFQYSIQLVKDTHTIYCGLKEI